MNQNQRETAIMAACFALRFLVHSNQRENARSQMEGFSDAAIFHRWMGLTWAFDEPNAFALLSESERFALRAFNDVFRSLAWTPIETHPFISDVSDEDLRKLIPAATALLQLLETRCVVDK